MEAPLQRYSLPMGVPRDYVLNPAPATPIKVREQATFDELFEVFADNRGVALVGAGDAEMGPYTRCIRVDAAEVDNYSEKGYRRLAPFEREAVLVGIGDFGDATD